jgi:Tfp pilus assembly protein PilX
MKDKKIGFANERGTALIATVLFLMAMGVLSTALLFTVQNDMKTSASYKYAQQSFYEANAVVQDGVQWFSNSYTPHANIADYDIAASPVKMTAGGSDVKLTASGTLESYPEENVVNAFASRFGNVKLEANASNSGVYDMDATLMKHWNTQCINPTTFAIAPCSIERWRLNGTGYWGTAAKPIGRAQITAVIENSGSAFFDRALWGKNSVDLRGAMLIDSYDPRLGVWSPGVNQGYNGAVGSNNLIDMGGNASVYGDIGIGPTGTIDPGGTVTGDTVRLSEDRTFEPINNFSVGNQNVVVNVKDVTTIRNGTNNNQYNNITVRGDLYFEPGPDETHPSEYYIDSLSQTGQGRIFVSGYTRLYVKSNLVLTGQGVLNGGTDSSQLEIFYSGTSAVTFEGGCTAYVELYAPDADITLRGNTDFSGSFIGNNVLASGGAQIHFSNGSLRTPLIKRNFRIITWSQDSY